MNKKQLLIASVAVLLLSGLANVLFTTG